MTYYQWTDFLNHYYPHCILTEPHDLDQLHYFAKLHVYEHAVLTGLHRQVEYAWQCFLDPTNHEQCLSHWTTAQGHAIHDMNPYLWYHYAPDGSDGKLQYTYDPTTLWDHAKVGRIANLGTSGPYKAMLFDNSIHAGFHYAMVKCCNPLSCANIEPPKPYVQDYGRIQDINIAGVVDIVPYDGWGRAQAIFLRHCGPYPVQLKYVTLVIGHLDVPAMIVPLKSHTLEQCELFSIAVNNNADNIFLQTFGFEPDMELDFTGLGSNIAFGHTSLMLLDGEAVEDSIREFRSTNSGTNPSLQWLVNELPDFTYRAGALYGRHDVSTGAEEWNFFDKLVWLLECLETNGLFFNQFYELREVTAQTAPAVTTDPLPPLPAIVDFLAALITPKCPARHVNQAPV